MQNIISLIKFTGVEGVIKPEEYIPERKSDGAVGYDIKAARVLDKMTREIRGDFPVTIKPGETVLIGNGIIMAIPEGIDCEVRPRSGLATKYDISLANAPGTVDPDYRGEIACALRNNGDKDFIINKGDRIGQLIFTPVYLPEFQFVKTLKELPETKRKSGGFGSTGMNSEEGFGTEFYDANILEIDEYMMRIVLATAERSKCARGCPLDENGIPKRDEKGKLVGQVRKLGCVIARDDKIIASGYNTQYPGSEDCSELGCKRDRLKIPSGEKLEMCNAIHAEEAAVLCAAKDTVSVVGATMFCNAEPCINCAKKIAALGIEALVVLDGGYSTKEGLKIVRKAGIKTRIIKL